MSIGYFSYLVPVSYASASLGLYACSPHESGVENKCALQFLGFSHRLRSTKGVSLALSCKFSSRLEAEVGNYLCHNVRDLPPRFLWLRARSLGPSEVSRGDRRRATSSPAPAPPSSPNSSPPSPHPGLPHNTPLA